MVKKEEIERLKNIAREIRIDILLMLNRANSGHTGGSLSSADIMTALFFYKIRHRPDDPKWDGRDRFILSKGHCAPTLYAVLARCGYFERKEIFTLRKLGSILQGHPDMKLTPGVEISTGSLGQGLSVANGVALAAKIDGKDTRIYVLLGDGEVQEGQVWEAAMLSWHCRLNNICAIIDNNGLQIDGKVENIMDIEPLSEKWRSFGWNAIKIDGHDFEQILNALDKAEKERQKPTVIIAKTVKGKGVSCFENKVEYHGVAPSDEELSRALKELGYEG